MIKFCKTLLPGDKVQTRPAELGETIKPIPVIDKVVEVDVAPMITNPSMDSRSLFRVL